MTTENQSGLPLLLKKKLPRNRYITRLLSSESKTSSKGNPMIEMLFEIAAPLTKKVDGVEYQIAGLQTRHYVTLTPATEGRVKEFLRVMGLPEVPLNPESPDLSIFDGLLAWCICEGEKQEELSDEVDEATGKRKPILDPDTNEPLVRYSIRIRDFIKKATPEQVEIPF
jgi:hypothetical protein